MLSPIRRFLQRGFCRLALSAGLTLCTLPLGVLPTYSDPLPPYTAPAVVIPHVPRPEPTVPVLQQVSQLSIPAIRLTASVRGVGILPDGKLDVPQTHTEVGLYTLGPKPGEAGTAVIDGHSTMTDGPGIFGNLHRLHIGDTIVVSDTEGRQRSFHIVDMQNYQVESAPLERIFGVNSHGAHLNLITCSGVWSRKYGHYDHRLVVYADADTGITLVAANTANK